MEEYNTQRKRLIQPEYGRNIQTMIDYLLTIQDRNERTRAAKTVIDVMGNLYPHLRDVPDFRHKLWDHLAIIKALIVLTANHMKKSFLTWNKDSVEDEQIYKDINTLYGETLILPEGMTLAAPKDLLQKKNKPNNNNNNKQNNKNFQKKNNNNNRQFHKKPQNQQQQNQQQKQPQ